MDFQQHYQEFTDALTHAFDDDQLRMLVTFNLHENFYHIVAEGPFLTRVFDLIRWCDQEGKVDELFLAAIQEKPGNQKLKDLARKIAGEVEATHTELINSVLRYGDAFKNYESPHAEEIRNRLADVQANGALQAAVVAAPHLKTGQDVIVWTTNLALARSRACFDCRPVVRDGLSDWRKSNHHQLACHHGR